MSKDNLTYITFRSRFPAPALPVFSLLIKLIPSAITISVVVTAVHISLGKIFGKRLGYTTDAGQELYALGFTSIFSSVFPMYPVSCSLSRTVVSVESGTKSQLSTVFSSVILAAVILWLGPMLRTLPMVNDHFETIVIYLFTFITIIF